MNQATANALRVAPPQLSPLTLARLRDQAQGEEPAVRHEVVEVDAYACPDCSKLHEDKSDAVECCEWRIRPRSAYKCQGCGNLHDDRRPALNCCLPSVLHDQDVVVLCPVCGTPHGEHRQAVDCCLWKDIDAPRRWQIADQVEAGATWLDAITAATGRAPW